MDLAHYLIELEYVEQKEEVMGYIHIPDDNLLYTGGAGDEANQPTALAWGSVPSVVEIAILA